MYQVAVDQDHTSPLMFTTDPRRKAPRRAVRLAAQVSFGDRANRLNCDIVDMSSAGAKLRVDMPRKQLNRRLCLMFDHYTTSVECQVIWIGDGEAGVRFCTRFERVARFD